MHAQCLFIKCADLHVIAFIIQVNCTMFERPKFQTDKIFILEMVLILIANKKVLIL